jgi:hypothetical protein
MAYARFPASRCALLLLLLVPASATPAASPFLPPDHWAVEALERLDALGLVSGWMPAQKSVPVLAVAAALDAAAAEAETSAPSLTAIIGRWRARLVQEWPGIVNSRAVLRARIAVGARVGDATEDPAKPVPAGPSALRLVDPTDTPYALAGAAVRVGAHVAAAATVRFDGRGAELTDADVVASGGWMGLAVGRARPGVGFSRGSGVVVSGEAVIDRFELFTTRPIALPALLGRAGAVTADSFVARLREPRHAGTSLLWASSVRWRVHPRLTLGAARAVMFGGDPWDDLPAWDRTRALVAGRNFRENNVHAVSARWRMPTEGVLPLTLEVDWGSDDDPLAAVKVPGIVAGLSAPMLGRLPITIGVEYAFFGRFCCREPWKSAPWYTHYDYPGGWVTGQVPIGDALGGDGRALRVRATLDDGSAVRISTAAWAQERFGMNLYSPQAGGRSAGGELSAELRLPRSSVELRGIHERGPRWHATQAAIEATVSF